MLGEHATKVRYAGGALYIEKVAEIVCVTHPTHTHTATHIYEEI